MRVPSWMNRRGASSWIGALLTGAMLLVIPGLLFLYVPPEDHTGWGVINKQWLVTLYLIAVGTFVVFPVGFYRWQSHAELIGEPAPRASVGAAARPAWWGLLGVLALAWYISGPPWHLERHHRDIETHEQAHLGPLQAIWKGYPAYVGPASTQYGPGSQALMYGVIKASGRFDIVSFRTSWAAINFAVFAIVDVAAWWWLGFWPAVAVAALAILYSPLAFYGTAPDGTLAGFYGWANALRYVGALIVAPSLARAVDRVGDRSPLSSRFVVTLGAVWGVTSWMSQENLWATGMSAGLFLVLVALTRSVTAGQALRIGSDLIVGFALVASAIMSYYAMRGDARAFVENYFLIPRAVAAGLANTWWPSYGTARRTFYFAPPFLLTLAVGALWKLPSLELRPPLDVRRARFLALVSVQLVCYQTSLLRSDSSHVQNTMLALPFVLVMAAQDAPRWLEQPRVARAAVRAAFVLLALVIFPAARLRIAAELFARPALRFVTSSVAGPRADPGGVAYARATPMLSDEPEVSAGSGVAMRPFLAFADDLHALVGDRKTYVAFAAPSLWSSLFYFLADLTPAPYPFDRDTMMIASDEAKARVVAHIRSHPADYECFVGLSLDIPEARAFIESHPTIDRHERTIGPYRVYVLIAGPAR